MKKILTVFMLFVSTSLYGSGLDLERVLRGDPSKMPGTLWNTGGGDFLFLNCKTSQEKIIALDHYVEESIEDMDSGSLKAAAGMFITCISMMESKKEKQKYSLPAAKCLDRYFELNQSIHREDYKNAALMWSNVRSNSSLPIEKRNEYYLVTIHQEIISHHKTLAISR